MIIVYEQEINIKQTSDENNIIYQLNEPMKKIELKFIRAPEPCATIA